MLDFDALQQLANKIQPLFVDKNLNFTLGKLKAHNDLNRFNELIEGFDLENIFPLLAKLNRTSELNEFLTLLNQFDSIQKQRTTDPSQTKILIIGRSKITENEIKKIFQECGIDINRVVIRREYTELKKQGIKANIDKYALILIGPTPHKTASTGDSCGTLSELKALYGDKVIVLQNNKHPKMTNNTITEAVRFAIAQHLIQPNTY
ncbi:MAG: hypothetical protein MJ156_02110 [Alphaproteobacteria bacterium]|nr:hypothetical protein [Alphaproteobacteria bacterium]